MCVRWCMFICMCALVFVFMIELVCMVCGCVQMRLCVHGQINLCVWVLSELMRPSYLHIDRRIDPSSPYHG